MSPHFTSLPNNITFAKEGTKVELHCRADGHPTPTIQWDRDSVMDGFTSDRYSIHKFLNRKLILKIKRGCYDFVCLFGRFSVDRNGTLTIQNAQQEDQGFYGCTAGNAGGFKRAEFRLMVKGKYLNFN